MTNGKDFFWGAPPREKEGGGWGKDKGGAPTMDAPPLLDGSGDQRFEVRSTISLVPYLSCVTIPS